MLTCKEIWPNETNAREISLTYVDPDEGGPRNDPKRYTLIVKPHGTVPIAELLSYIKDPYAQSSFSTERLRQTLQEIQGIVIREPSTNPENFSGSKSTKFFSYGKQSESVRLGIGIIALKGYHTSVRSSTSRLLANVNVCTSAFYEHGNLAEIMKVFISKEGSCVGPRLMKWVNKLRVQRTDMKMVKTVGGLNKQDATQYVIELSDGETIDGSDKVTVERYFEVKHQKTLRSPSLPLIDVGSKPGTPTCYLPAEILRVLPGQPYRRKLVDDDEESNMTKFGVRPPAANAQRITFATKEILKLNPQPDVLRNFGIKCGGKEPVDLLTVQGRILKTPKLRYATHVLDPQSGKWDIKNKKVSESKPLKKWSFLNFTESPSITGIVSNAVREFQKAIHGYGLGNAQPKQSKGYSASFVDPSASEKGEMVPNELKDGIIRDVLAKAAKEGIEFLLVVLPNKDTFTYSSLKYWADTTFGMHTVCCTLQTIAEPKPDTWANLVLKANLRLGGVNQCLPDDELGYLQHGTTMMVGIDVTHPPLGSMQNAKSIAAAVANTDNKTFAQWPVSLELQTGRQEIVENLRDMFVKRLKAWQSINDSLPNRIMVFRDGVSDTQYDEVLNTELKAIKEGRDRVYGKQPSELVMIVVGKRHHTRFYPTVKTPNTMNTNNGNCKPGTVVDRGVTMEKGWDFFLQSHNAIAGTAKPAHYVVIYSEAGPELTANKLEQLVRDLVGHADF